MSQSRYRRSCAGSPADSVAFCTSASPELWDSPAGKAVATFIAGSEPRMMENFEREIWRAVGADRSPHAFAAGRRGRLREPGVVIRITTRQPYDRAKGWSRRWACKDRPTGRRRWGGAKMLFRHRRGDQHIHLTDAKNITLLIGDGGAGLLSRMLEGETKRPAQCSARSRAKGDQFVAAIDATRLRDLRQTRYPGIDALPVSTPPSISKRALLIACPESHRGTGAPSRFRHWPPSRRTSRSRLSPI